MSFEPRMLGMMEERGYTDTNEGLINRVAYKLKESQNDTIDTAEFRSACISCNVDPDSFTQSDLKKLQDKLNRIT